jgi:LacI family transcriptional regulator
VSIPGEARSAQLPFADWSIMPTINQQLIADELKISRTTVSRCFTNHKGINPKTRSEVFSLAAKLGYQYRQPRNGATEAPKVSTIGVLICSDVEEFYSLDYESPGVELLPGVSEFAQLHNWHTEVHFGSPNVTTIAHPSYRAIRGLRKRLWSGLILMYPFSPRIIGELAPLFPCVSLVEQYGQTSVDCVDVNHSRGIAGLMERLRQNGHTRIGFFSHNYSVEAVWSYRRFSAYVENLTRSGWHYNEKDVISLDLSSPATIEEGYNLVINQIKDGVTAWMCAADRQAYELILTLRARGYQVPQDVSVTGFDGILRPPDAPALDTVRIPYHEIGFAACRRLFDKINKRFDSPQEILLDCRLQEGETIGPPRQ